MIRTAGGTFDPSDRHVYFLASNVERMRYAVPFYQHLLVAVNELEGKENEQELCRWLDGGKRVFLDSGIFNLTNEHARAHGCSMDQALALAPEEIDGFDRLFDRYCELVSRYGDRLWGYIELDQGGRENKIRTRARLEALGFRPIPVYHPFNDGWEYFDQLAKGYDRMCFGNVVQASMPVRKRLVATAWERHRAYPNLWIHLLGYTPNETLNAFPCDSADSSSWLSAVRWAGYTERSAGRLLGYCLKDLQYALGSDPTGPTGSRKAAALSAYGEAMKVRNWRNLLKERAASGVQI